MIMQTNSNKINFVEYLKIKFIKTSSHLYFCLLKLYCFNLMIFLMKFDNFKKIIPDIYNLRIRNNSSFRLKFKKTNILSTKIRN